ncbi:MAG: sulfurtransferase [Reichenbachiella sp.]|uniref:sulfurtransferase n=1 Tax=Reichenbachiella sp. TaxID=2184521 RepID=UPI0032657EF6
MRESIVRSEWLKKNLDDPNLIILDASPAGNQAGLTATFDGVGIPGTRIFDLKNSFSDPETDLPHMLPSIRQFERECRKLGINNSSKIIVYDHLGIYTSPRVWWMFRAMGHEQIAILDGGLPAWIAEEYETESFKNKVFVPGDFSANFSMRSVKSLTDIAKNLHTKDSILIDARSQERFNGLAPEPRKGLGSGHIPKSINIPYETVLRNGKYKSKTELTALFEEHDLGVRPLIFSCGSGVTACIVLLASEQVIKNTKSVFDGSWTQWASTEGLPIDK